jgi:predicted nucleic acid-binding protein
MLATPADLWQRAADLGRACRQAGVTAGALDLLIAAVAIHHGAELITFDTDFQKIAVVSSLQVKLLLRPAP